MTQQSEAAARACERLLGMAAQRVERPGGHTRRSVRVFLQDRTVVVTRRRHPERARLEAEVLQALGAQDAPVPLLLAFDGEWLIQEDLGSQRLSQTLAVSTEAEGEALLIAAITGLAAVQAAGQTAQLERRVVVIGSRPEWLMKLVTMPERVGEQLHLPAPSLQKDRLVAQLRTYHPTFIKWDARPANAVARADQSVAWFDWEHCGSRNPLDDLAWFLCDEYTPDWPDAEARLIARFLPSLLNGSSADAGLDYLMTFGALHSCVRLSLILTEKADGPWWDAQRCLDQDHVGVTREMALRLCRHAARWSEQGTLTRDLGGWLKDVTARLE